MISEGYFDRLLGEKDLASISGLYKHAFKRRPELDVFKWKYFQNPAGNAIWVGVVHGEDVIAAGAMVPEDVFVFTERRTMYKCTDLMVHPEHQRRGLAKRIINQLKKHIARNAPLFSYTLCAKHATFGFQRNDFRHSGEMKTFFIPFCMLKMKFLALNLKNPYQDGKVRKFDSPLAPLDGFDFRRTEERISVKKSADFLRWRMANPKYQYQLIGYFENDKLEGYLIYSVGRANMMNIIDIETLPNFENVGEKLILAAEYEAYVKKYRAILLSSVGSNYFTCQFDRYHLLKNPFKRGPMKSQIDFNICIDNNYDERVFNVANWEVYALHYDDV